MLHLCTVLVAVLMSSRLGRTTAMKVIDSHLHIWAKSSQTTDYPLFQSPPDALTDTADTASLLECMKASGVDGALIVQPINHKFDHSYVRDAIRAHPSTFKGLLLHDPQLDPATAVQRLEELVLQGFVGVRFNPYLWEQTGERSWKSMTDPAGRRVYERCGSLQIPVGIMCFHGLDRHLDDIRTFLETYPDTNMILDHFAFTKIDDDSDTTTFPALLELSRYPNLYVKISALFRLDDPSPYARVKTERFDPLVRAFGPERLLYGSDFPFVQLEPEGYHIVDLVREWCGDDGGDAEMILGGTAERLFGKWG